MRRTDGEVILLWTPPVLALIWLSVFLLFPGFATPMSPTASAAGGGHGNQQKQKDGGGGGGERKFVYLFYLDFLGNARSRNARAALGHLREFAVVVRVLERQEASDADFAADSEALRSQLTAERQNQFFSAYMEKAKTKLLIDIDMAAFAQAIV